MRVDGQLIGGCEVRPQPGYHRGGRRQRCGGTVPACTLRRRTGDGVGMGGGWVVMGWGWGWDRVGMG